MYNNFTEEARRILVSAKAEMKELKHPYVGSEHLLLAILKDNNEPIGTIDVVKKDISNKVFELGHCYSKVSWGKGYATEAFKKVISFLFDEVGVEVIMAKHYENNLASGKVMLKSGMTYEATLRSRIIDKVTKERVGEVYYSITKDEYLRTM